MVLHCTGLCGLSAGDAWVSVFVFVAIRLVPGDAITAMLGTEGGMLTAAQREAMTAYFGLDQKWAVQYIPLARRPPPEGDPRDLGHLRSAPVLRDIILERFPLTLQLSLMSMVHPPRLRSALARGPASSPQRGPTGRPTIVRIFAMIGQSMPNFVVALPVDLCPVPWASASCPRWAATSPFPRPARQCRAE